MSGREPRNSMSGTIAATEFENSLYSSETSYSPLSSQSSQQHSSAHDRHEDLNKSVNGECSGNSHVFPSSLSRLGPRVLAKDSTVIPLATSSRGDSGGEADTGAAWPTSDNNLTQIEPSGISHSQFAESDLRSRLLSRLQEGKDHALSASAARRATEEQGQGSRFIDPIIAEEQLKKRAQLRMKLAAEKRVMLSGHNEG